MIKEEFFYDSCSGGKIRGCRWVPEGKPVAICQIIHGIAEHIDRYDVFASFLCQHGILVVAEDHMGHGKSYDEDHPGYFYGGWFAAVNDCVFLQKNTRKEYPNIPFFLFGHSMGSFLTRSILILYPDLDITAAIICGTGWQSHSVLAAGIHLSSAICRVQNEKLPNMKLYSMIFGAYNKRVEHPRTPFDWLTRDSGIVDSYISDPLCGFIPSVALVRDMLLGMRYNEQSDNLLKMKKDLPVLFVAGGDDPVGNYGKGVKRTEKAFTDSGMIHVSTRIFPLCRHEILNEINRNEVFDYILKWMKHLI